MDSNDSGLYGNEFEPGDKVLPIGTEAPPTDEKL
jgi:hypothetical protein